MKRLSIAAAARTGAALGAIFITWALLSAVVSLSEPQQSQLIAATASRQTASRKQELAVARSKQMPTLVAVVTPR